MKQTNSSVKIGGRAFILSAAIILILMIFSGVLTKVLPAGMYERDVIDGRTLVVNGSFREIARPDYPVWRWFTAPVEVLFGPDSITAIMLIILIACIGGSMAVLEKSGVMEALIKFLSNRFSKRKYLLLTIMIFLFMAISSLIGSFEELVPLIIFIIPIAISLGWDSLTGLGMSLLPVAFGFSAAITNPFTVALAQRIAGVPAFSGVPLRLVIFLIVFALVWLFVFLHAKKVEKNPQSSICYKEDEILRQKLKLSSLEQNDNEGSITKEQKKALIWFASCIIFSLVFILSTTQIPGLSDIAFPLMTLMFLLGGIGSGVFVKMPAGVICRTLGKGVLGFLPGIILILMAYSVKHIISTGMIIDTILFYTAEMISGSSPITAAFLVYGAVLIMNFFIGTASAKAFLMMPLLAPLADLTGITRQTAVLAFTFGDGFSNMMFPTNPLLMIALSLTVIGYTKWMRWTWKLQAAILAVTLAFLAIAVRIGFGPF